ncbi:uncharacterized protein LOC134099867 [Sardina pilchardus]|uniref:uncharacterized protein LOC134099867 n=1 Tax=Sardina pilchardus TaxID=27697 RepID=UPI002E12E3C8
MASIDQLFKTLDELKSAELSRFRTYLSEVDSVVEAFEPIPRGKLENSDATDVASKMKQAYGEEGSVKMTLTILRKMNLNHLADNLESESRKSHAQGEQHEESTITHVANGSGAPVQLYYSTDIRRLRREVVPHSTRGDDTVRVNFKDETVSFERIPRDRFAKLDIRGPIYVSVYVESNSSSDGYVQKIVEKKEVPNNRSFIVTKDYHFKWQALGEDIWQDEQGEDHKPR